MYHTPWVNYLAANYITYSSYNKIPFVIKSLKFVIKVKYNFIGDKNKEFKNSQNINLRIKYLLISNITIENQSLMISIIFDILSTESQTNFSQG